jgi:hypothetical protein
MKTQIICFVCLLILFGFVSCTQTPDMSAQSTSTRLPIYTATQHITQTFVGTLSIIATPVPVQPTYVKITPDEAQIANWKEYETALANEIMYYYISKGNEIICEWELIGQNEKEMYIWTICSTSAPLITDASEDYYPTTSIPALIQLDDNGNVIEVKIPGNYARDIRKLFPVDVQEIIFHHQRLDIKSLQEHLQTRRKDPDSPPLIVEAATNIP